MARIAGRSGRLYMNLTSGGTAEPVAFLNNWSLNFATEKINVTGFGDAAMVYVSGLPDMQGSYAGFYDDATVQMYTAAVDGVARRFYLYPDNTSTGKYWFGTAIFDMNVDASVDGAVAISGSFAAASVTSKIG
jgi:hypothetical protein